MTTEQQPNQPEVNEPLDPALEKRLADAAIASRHHERLMASIRRQLLAGVFALGFVMGFLLAQVVRL